MTTKPMDRYFKAAHAMQSGVAFQMQNDPDLAATSPKHLRVGVNSAHVSIDALTKLLLEKCVFSGAEWEEALASAMEAEVDRYEAQLPDNVKLG